MTVLFHFGTLSPVIGSGCVLSAVSLQYVMKTLVHLAQCICMSCDESYYTAMILICASLVMFLCIFMYASSGFMFFYDVIRNMYFHFLIITEVGLYL